MAIRNSIVRHFGSLFALSVFVFMAQGCGGSGAQKPQLIEVTPSIPVIMVGETKQLTATAMYSDNSTTDITAAVTWHSSDPAVVSVDTNGDARGISAGKATITATATFANMSGGTTVSVGAVTASLRFTDNGNGTVKDNKTGLVWLKDANCFGFRAWDWANYYAGTIPGGDMFTCGLTDGSKPGDWRLPTANELESLVDTTNYGPALPTGNPFVNVVSYWYWTSELLDLSGKPTKSSAWACYVNVVDIESGAKDFQEYDGASAVGYKQFTWPVRKY